MEAPKLYPDDLDASDLRQMEALISGCAGGARVSLDQAVVATLCDILLPRGATAPRIEETTPNKLLGVLWPHGAPSIANLTNFAADVQSMLADWHLLH